MTAQTIYELCCHLPEDPRSGDAYRAITGDIPNLNLNAPGLQFVTHYKNLHFGWDAAQTLAKERIPFPVCNANYVWRAYLYLCDGKKYFDEDIMGAVMLRRPEFGRRREILHALLVATDLTAQDAADQLGMLRGSVEAYEKLFFNVTDRKRDIALLAEVAYPETRLVEQMAGYMQNEALSNLLLRFGYNNGPLEVLYFAGVNNSLLQGLANADSPQRLEALIMSSGYLMARNNLLQPQGFYQAAKGMIAAAKAAGTPTAAESPTTSMSVTLAEEILTFKQDQARSRLLKYRDNNAVQTLPFEVVGN